MADITLIRKLDREERTKDKIMIRNPVKDLPGLNFEHLNL